MTGVEHEPPRRSIADAYQDLLAPLDEGYRRSLIGRLAQGFYEGWTPTRPELAVLIAEDTGRLGANHGLETRSAQVTGPGASTATSIDSRPPPSPATAVTRPGHAKGSSGEGETFTRHNRAAPAVIASFEVDCGELSPRYRFIARSLGTAGMVKRGSDLCRLVFLNYELRPLIDRDEWPSIPMLFDAPIICSPDHLVPVADGDGQDQHHKVAGSRVIARRGPWPLSGRVKLVRFRISQQTPPGRPPDPTPAGTLIVDLSGKRAVWRHG